MIGGQIWSFAKRALPGVLLLICALAAPTSNGQSVQRVETDQIKRLLVRIDTLLDFDYAEGVFIYDYPQAVQSAELALKLARKSADQSLLSQALTKRARVHWFNGEYPPSITLNSEAIRIRTTLNDLAGMADNFNGIALNYYYSAHYDSAIANYNRALKIQEKLGDISKQRMLLNHLALAYYKMCQYKQVLFYTQEAGRLTEPSVAEPVIAISAPKTTYRDDVYYRSVLKDQIGLLSRIKGGDSPRELIMVLRNIAFTYQQLSLFDSTLMYFGLAKKVAERTGIIPHLIDHGNAFRASGNPDSAISYYQEALKENTRRGTRIHVHWAHQMMSDAYFDKKEYGLSLLHANESLDVNLEMNNRHSVAGDYIRVARIHMATSNLDSALQAASRGIALSRIIMTHAHTATLLKLLSEISARKGLFKQAYTFDREYQALFDSIASGESDLTLAELQIAYEVKKTAAEVAQLNAANKVQEAQLQNRNVLIISGVIGLVLMTALALVTYLGYQNKQKANRILQQSNSEKDLLLGEIHHRVKNNLQVISSILNLQSRRLSDLGAKDAILNGRNRVKAMALVHQQLYQSDRFASIQVEDYLRLLIETVAESFGYEKDQYLLDYQVDNLELDVDSAIYIGLIVNEVISNAFKHAFEQDAHNTLKFRLFESGNEIHLEVKDNGTLGWNKQKDKRSGFGMYLVENLVNDMNGEIKVEKQGGTTINVILRAYKRVSAAVMPSE